MLDPCRRSWNNSAVSPSAVGPSPPRRPRMGGALIVADDNQAGKRFAEFLQGKGLTATVWQVGALDATQVAELRPERIIVASKTPQAAQVCQQPKLDPCTNLIPLIVGKNHAPAP